MANATYGKCIIEKAFLKMKPSHIKNPIRQIGQELIFSISYIKREEDSITTWVLRVLLNSGNLNNSLYFKIWNFTHEIEFTKYNQEFSINPKSNISIFFFKDRKNMLSSKPLQKRDHDKTFIFQIKMTYNRNKQYFKIHLQKIF